MPHEKPTEAPRGLEATIWFIAFVFFAFYGFLMYGKRNTWESWDFLIGGWVVTATFFVCAVSCIVGIAHTLLKGR